MTVFNLFKIGIGPSSSHTVGPMLIAKRFCATLKNQNYLIKTTKIKIELFGSLGLTGQGHQSDIAILLGLLGETPKEIDTNTIEKEIQDIKESKSINLLQEHEIKFDFEKDLTLYKNKSLPFHPNAIKLTAFENDSSVFSKVYYSIGGGEILCEDEIESKKEEIKKVPYYFSSANELLDLCKINNLSISQLMLENEKTYKSEEQIREELIEIWSVMKTSIENGIKAKGFLPGILNVEKRANKVYTKLKAKTSNDSLDLVDWINLYALAVNEENASGKKIVTAPTNGASGIIPAVLNYIITFLLDEKKEEDVVVDFLLTAGAIGLLYQKNASISGADVGCQGEVGVACSMAAAGMANFLDASIEQIENAAEIGMEHNLGLTCDPIAGLVQIPCIERNAIAAMKAVNAARMAINEDGRHYVSLDQVIKTMYDTGKDMKNKYKETSKGGLAVNYIEC